LKNAGIQTSSTRAEISVEIKLREQLAAEQESNATLVELVDELKRKTEKTKSEFEEFKKRQQEEYNRLCEQVMRLSSPVTLSLQFLRLDAVNICGLLCGLM
jgi:predicted nuclease with TOPRIM domain